MIAAQRIVVVRAHPGLGDLLCATPALRALRAAHPGAHVTLVALPWARGILGRFAHYVDEVLDFPGFPGIPEVPVEPSRIVAFLADAQAREFDLAIQLHGSGVASNAFTQLLGARRTAGAYARGTPAPDGGLFVPYPDDEPEPRRALRVLEHLGIPAQGDALELPLTSEDDAERKRTGLATGAYACVHPGASIPERRWPAERFAAVADALAQRGLRVVLTGTDAEAPISSAVAAAMRAEPLDLTGRTSLGGLGALVRDAAVTVTNDTGTSHLAAAVGGPSVVVYSTSDRDRWAPIDESLHRRVGTGAPESADVPVADVVAAVDALLARA